MPARTAPAAGRPFADASAPPSEEAVRAVLGASAAAYDRLLGLAAGYTLEWTFSKGSGWMLKIHARGKALCYVIPLPGSFRVSMAIRDTERASLLADDWLADIREQLESAPKYAEGYALRFDVPPGEAPTGAAQPALETLLTRLLAMRG